MSDVVDTLTERMAELQHHARERGQAARHARMREGLLARFEDSPAVAAGPRWWAWSLAAGAVAAAVLLVWVALRPGPLTFQVEPSAGSNQAQAFIAAGDEEPLALTFSDGSAVELRPRARVRVGALRGDGADLVLESGTLAVSIEPQASGSWSIAAGPYRVDVVGTVFSVGWEPEQEAFALELQRGEVQVRGPGIEGVRVVAEGERLVILGRAEQAVAVGDAAEIEGTAVEAQAAVAQPPEVAADDEPRAGAARRPSGLKPGKGAPRSNEADGWRELAHQGSYREAITAAEAAGFSKLCTSLDAAALLELADAGRYARKPARAREALVALRKRFAGSDAAAVAAFDLGRLGSGGASGCEDAAKWFRTYLRERPQGSMAEAARKRIDECTEGSVEEADTAP
jgi:transmembrane sensor